MNDDYVGCLGAIADRLKATMGDESLECLGSVVEEGVEMGDEEMLNGQEDDDSLASTQNPDYREERFRVDRRKLEQLLQGM